MPREVTGAMDVRKGLVALVVLGAVLVVAGACQDEGGGTTGEATPTQAASASTQTGGEMTGDPAEGATLFASSCAACHGADARGIPGLGKDLVASDFTKGLSDAELVAFIKRGRDSSDPLNTTGVAMPPKGGNPALDDADLYHIVAYLRSIEA
jgi:disulfide bond formation protein DsbB